MDSDLITYCVDVRSKKDKTDSFAWARLEGTTNDLYQVEYGIDIDVLMEKFDDEVNTNPIIPQFDYPLYQTIPGPDSSEQPSKYRNGKDSQSCFLPAGPVYSGLLSLHQMTYFLQNLNKNARQLTLDCPPNLDFQSKKLYLLEAFVSQGAHTDTDNVIQDAITGKFAFLEPVQSRNELTSDLDKDDDNNRKFLSLAGAALLWNNPDFDVDVLHEKTLVVRPQDSYEEDKINCV